jgi:uncharacterized membrane protein YgcG
VTVRAPVPAADLARRAARWRRVRAVLRIAQLVCVTWVVSIVVQVLTADPAAADNCGTFADCFGQTGSAAEAAFGLTLLAGLSLALDLIPVVGDVKGVAEAVTGRDLLTGQELEPWERALGLIPFVPAADAARVAGKLGGTAADAAAGMARHGDELGASASAGTRGSRAGDARTSGSGGGAGDPGSAGPAGAAGGGASGGGGGRRPPSDEGPPGRGGDGDAPRDRDGGGEGGDPRDRRLDELAADPAHGGRIDPRSRAEAEVGQGLEESGRVAGLRRDPTGAGEFIDSQGRTWDVKAFRSNVPAGARGGFTVDSAMSSIRREIMVGENVMVDTRHLSTEHVQELQEAVRSAGLDEQVLFWP